MKSFWGRTNEEMHENSEDYLYAGILIQVILVERCFCWMRQDAKQLKSLKGSERFPYTEK